MSIELSVIGGCQSIELRDLRAAEFARAKEFEARLRVESDAKYIRRFGPALVGS